MEKFTVPKRIQNELKDIFIYQNGSEDGYTMLPFYADGYPGIVYTESKEATAKIHEEKELSPFFIYGQTVEPITLKLKNPYLLLIFRIEPITGYQILSTDSSELINDCMDLTHAFEENLATQVQYLQNESLEYKISTITDFISDKTMSQEAGFYPEIQKAIRIIIEKEGDVSIKNISESLYISERTFQRKFQKVVGVSPKQLALIIRYHVAKQKQSDSLLNASVKDSYADQSHFIKQFKRYSGKTPVEYFKYIKSINHQPLD